MLRRTFVAFLFLLSPAFANLHIYEDFTIDEFNAPLDGSIVVYNDARLTISGNPRRIRPIYMYDTASLLVEGGWLRFDVRLHGSHEVMFTGGRLHGGQIEAVPGAGSNSVQFLGGDIHGSVILNQAVGPQSVFIDFTQFDAANMPPPAIFGNASTFVQAVAINPYYRGTSSKVIGDLLMTDDVWAHSTRVADPPNWSLTSASEFLSGDSNRDGRVDLEDLNAVRNDFGTTWPLDMAGDTLPYDGLVDLADLNRVRNNFGLSTPVPEPSSFVLLAVGVGMLAMAGRLARHRALRLSASPLRTRRCRCADN